VWAANVLFPSLPTIATVIFIVQLIHFNILLLTKQLQGGLSFNRFRVQSQRLATASVATASVVVEAAASVAVEATATAAVSVTATAGGRSSAQNKGGCI
jgi:hypothetical protein